MSRTSLVGACVGLAACAPSGPQLELPSLDAASVEAQSWCALAQVVVENVQPAVLDHVEVVHWDSEDDFVKSKPSIDGDVVTVHSYLTTVDDGLEQIACKLKSNAAVERDLDLEVGTRRDCAAMNRLALEVAAGWHEDGAPTSTPLPLDVVDDRVTATGSAWVARSLEVTDEGVRGVRLRTGLAVPIVPGMSYCKLLTVEAAGALVP
ncbi:MAG: hypothetical protein KTR31_31280 [Myxococcales bacterium]|nr:hypothetical protein [Myxococcales bacterium]